MPVDDIDRTLDAALRWGPWYLAVIGAIGLMASTLLYNVHQRSVLWLLDRPFVRDAFSRIEAGRQHLMRMRRIAVSRGWRIAAIVQSILMLAAGVAWLAASL